MMNQTSNRVTGAPSLSFEIERSGLTEMCVLAGSADRLSLC